MFRFSRIKFVGLNLDYWAKYSVFPRHAAMFSRKFFCLLPEKTKVLFIQSETEFKAVLLSEASLDRFRLISLECSLNTILIFNW